MSKELIERLRMFADSYGDVDIPRAEFEDMDIALIQSAADALERAEQETKRAFDVLALYGVPQERAKTVANGEQQFAEQERLAFGERVREESYSAVVRYAEQYAIRNGHTMGKAKSWQILQAAQSIRALDLRALGKEE